MNIDEYIAAQGEDIQEILSRVRDVIRETLPDAREKMSWQMPTFWKGRNLIHFAAHKNHLGIYPGPEAVEHFAPGLKEAGYRYSKGAIQFPYGNVPFDLIREIAEYCGKMSGTEC